MSQISVLSRGVTRFWNKSWCCRPQLPRNERKTAFFLENTQRKISFLSFPKFTGVAQITAKSGVSNIAAGEHGYAACSWGNCLQIKAYWDWKLTNSVSRGKKTQAHKTKAKQTIFSCITVFLSSFVVTLCYFFSALTDPHYSSSQNQVLILCDHRF